MSLAQPPFARDVTPAFSDTTAAIAEQRLEKMFVAIRRRQVKAVGLWGSDPKDILFLAQQTRHYCPDVQLFTLDNHILFTHPDFNKYFEGAVVTSTYPLFMDVQEWHSGIGPRFNTQYSSGTTEGVFNATLAHLNKLYPDNAIDLVDYQIPFCDHSATPPLWLSIVGRDAIWPMKSEVPSSPNLLKSSGTMLDDVARSGRVIACSDPARSNGHAATYALVSNRQPVNR